MPKQSKRELIIQEAALIFKQKGYSATSMRELAEKVGMEAASLYNHIRSKDEILEEICFKVANQYVSHISSIEDTKESNVQKLRDLIQLHVRMIIDEPNEVSVANNDWKNLSDTKKELYKTIRKGYEKRIANLIKAGIEAGEFKELNVSVALFTLLSSLRWIELWYKPGRDITPEQLENRISKKGVLNSVLPATRKAKLWDSYIEMYKEIAKEASDDFQKLFGEAFRQAYEEQVRLLQDADPEEG